jgi:hypothetical protein
VSRPVLVSLSLFLRRPALWLFVLWFLGISGVAATGVLGWLVWVVSSAFLWGLLVGSLTAEVLHCSFSIVMPAEPWTQRRVLLLGVPPLVAVDGLVAGLVIGDPRALGAGIGLALLVYSATAVMCWRVDRPGGWGGLVPLAMLGVFLPEGTGVIGAIVVEYWFMLLGLGVATAYVCWRRMGERELVRRACGRFVFGAFDIWTDTSRTQRELLAERAERQRMSVPEWAFRSLEAVGGHSLRGYLIGGLARSVAGWLPWNASRMLLIVFPLIVFYGYLLGGHGTIAFYLIGGAFGFHSCQFLEEEMLLPAGRRNRFLGSLILGLVQAGLLCVWCVVVLVLSQALVPYLPAINWRGQAFAYHPLVPGALYVTPALFAVAAMLRVLVPGGRGRRWPLALLFGALFPFAILFRHRIPAGGWVATLAIAGAWACYALVLFRFQKRAALPR